jgi:hypothetical protein
VNGLLREYIDQTRSGTPKAESASLEEAAVSGNAVVAESHAKLIKVKPLHGQIL